MLIRGIRGIIEMKPILTSMVYDLSSPVTKDVACLS